MSMRQIRPKDEKEESPVDPNTIPETSKSSSKRRCVSSACLPCRRRKSKCDGGKPYCSTCTHVYRTPCAYDVESDHRRKAALKRDIEVLKEQNGALGVIIASIKSCSESDVTDIVQQIRADEDLESIADSLRKNVTYTQPPDSVSAEGELSNMIGRPSTDESGVVKHFGLTSSLGLVSSPVHAPLVQHRTGDWTTVTKDADLIGHLMELYFCWSHPFYALFNKQAFLSDLASGRTKYCSSLLVNAILSLACHYSDRTDLIRIAEDSSTAGDLFFAEAERLLAADGTSCLTTVQALSVMGLREPSCGRDSSGFAYAGRACRMAIELGLHLTFETDNHKMDPAELEVRKHTFWGLFTMETAWGVCIGRTSMLPRAAVNVERPPTLEEHDQTIWMTVTDYGVDHTGTEQPGYFQTFQHQFSLLTEIVSDTVFSFYAPRERFTSRKLLDYYRRYKSWYSNLPSPLQIRDITLPHVLALHMWYHCSLLHLFKAFLRVDLVRSDVSPRDVCTQSSNCIAHLLNIYRRTYGMRHTSIVICHIILTSNIIDLINLPDPIATHNLALGLTFAREGATNHTFYMRGAHILLALSKQWNIDLPLEVTQAASEIPTKLPMSCVRGSATPQPWPPVATTTTQTFPAQTVQESYTGKDSQNNVPFYTAQGVAAPPNGVSPPQDFFWTPFPGQNVPIHAVQQQSSGPMDISAMVDVQQGTWDQLNRDGFKMVSANHPIPGTNGYPNGSNMHAMSGWAG